MDVSILCFIECAEGGNKKMSSTESRFEKLSENILVGVPFSLSSFYYFSKIASTSKEFLIL